MKKIYINENKLKEIISESYNDDFSKDNLDYIRYRIIKPEMDDYDSEWYDSVEEFVKDNTEYDIECWDIDSNMTFSDYVSYDDLVDMLGEEIANQIANDEGSKDGSEYKRLSDLYEYNNVNVDDVQAVINELKRRFDTYDEFNGSFRGYILVDGSIMDIGPNVDHNCVTWVDGMTVGKFVSLGNIRVFGNGFELEKEPNYEQRRILSKLINHFSDNIVYVDIVKYGNDNKMYSEQLTNAQYNMPDYRLVLGEIDRFFSEGIKLKGGYSMYESKITENYDLEVAPSDVDLDSFEVEDELNGKIWDKGVINSMVRLKLLDIADDFFDTLNVRWIKPKDIILTGSICNYNWSEYSDIDLHIVIDFKEVDENVELVRDYFNCKKNEWNNDHDELEVFDFPVELYVQNSDELAISDGVYSLEKNKWLKKPEKKDNNLLDNNSSKVKLISSSIMTKIDDMFDEYEYVYDKHKLEVLSKKVDKLLDKIRELRKNSLSDGGEYSIGNICYKVLRRTDYLNTLWDLKIKIYDKINSIE